MKKRRKSVKNWKVSAVGEKRYSDGTLKNLLEKREFVLFFQLFLDYARFLPKNAVFKRNNQLRVSVRDCVWYTICEESKRVQYSQIW